MINNTKKVPVFLHVPKNAGTYTIDVLHKHLTRLYNYDLPDDYNKIKIPMKRVTVTSPAFSWDLLVCFLTNHHETDPNMKRHHISVMRNRINDHVRECDLHTIRTYINNKHIDVLAGVLNPRDVLDCRAGLFEMKHMIRGIGKTPWCFTALREPFARQQSLYNYLISNTSIHEPTHGSLQFKTINDYIMSHFIEDSWVVRSCTGAPLTTELDRNWFQLANDFLCHNKFNVYDVRYTDKMIRDVTTECWNTQPNDKDSVKAHVNKQSYTRVNFDDLDSKTASKFKTRLKWDIAMYNKYCIK